jgi:hypothetical protein
VDASLRGLYAPGVARVDRGSPDRCVIGRGVAKVLSELGVPFENCVYQPQARAVEGVDLERGWPELLGQVQPASTF